MRFLGQKWFTVSQFFTISVHYQYFKNPIANLPWIVAERAPLLTMGVLSFCLTLRRLPHMIKPALHFVAQLASPASSPPKESEYPPVLSKPCGHLTADKEIVEQDDEQHESRFCPDDG